jgi:phosphoribosyl-AMP cyclohydrolase
MITISQSDNIVIIESSHADRMKFRLRHVATQDALSILDVDFSDPKVKIYSDCDEDVFLLARETLDIHDSLSLLWEKSKSSREKLDREDVLKFAPDLFPMFAIDLDFNPLMLAWGKPDSIRQSISSGHGTYFSRSRNKKWVKGEESGHLQNLNEIYVCFDPFYILYVTDQIGAACHTGYYSCFFRQIFKDKEPLFLFDHKVGDFHE